MILQVGVKVLLQNTEQKYLFLRRAPSFKSGPQKWDVPGGRINPEESLDEALRREVSEETSLKLTKLGKLLGAQDIFVKERDLHVVRLTYVGSAEGEVSISDEHDDYRWMTIAEVRDEEYVDSYLLELVKNSSF